MNLDSANARTAPFSAEERAAIEEQLERVLENRHFNHSRRFPAFLRFVVTRTLDGDTDQLKERTLGVEIFGRPADYDTSSDPIVRVTAAEIRKRIAQYYQEPGHEQEPRITMEVGSYVPQFALPSTAQVGSPHDVRTAGAPSLPLAATEAEAGVPVAPVAQRPASAKTRQPLRSLWRPAVLALAVLFVAAGLVASWRSIHTSPIEFFWGPILSSQDPVSFCIVEQRNFSGLAVDADDPSKQIINKTEMYTVNLQDAAAVVNISGVLHAGGKKYTLKATDSTTMSDVSAGPTIFIGAFDNPWTMRLTHGLRFRFGNDPQFTHEWIYDSSRPGPPQWFTQRPADESVNDYREYALIARFVDPDTGQPTIIVAGIGQASTRAAGEFLANPSGLAQLQRLAPHDGRKNLEAVLSTQIIDGQAGEAKVEAAYFW
ncbi:MAG: hypothetical protein KGK08_07775 [Acidobacteriota bacterium]|nr:hypothetical protein [Acidobacteriota bacterium]